MHWPISSLIFSTFSKSLLLGSLSGISMASIAFSAQATVSQAQTLSLAPSKLFTIELSPHPTSANDAARDRLKAMDLIGDMMESFKGNVEMPGTVGWTIPAPLWATPLRVHHSVIVAIKSAVLDTPSRKRWRLQRQVTKPQHVG